MKWFLFFTNLLTITFTHPPVYREEPQLHEQTKEAADRPDHLEGVPLERNGDLNKDFRKEILLGNVKPRNSDEAKDAIRNLFKEADLDKDGFLSSDELEKVIHKNAMMHIEESKREVEELFRETDFDHNQQVTWEEYSKRFVIETDHDSLRESFEAMDDDKTKSLNLTEFTGFLHPELAKRTVEELAEDLLKGYDRDGNRMISRSEFVEYSEGELDGPFAEEEKKEQEARGVEFDRDLDQNGDGFATLEELIGYVDPQGEGRHQREVSELIWQVDLNEDGKLALKEMLAQNLLLERSSLFEAGRKLHEDL
ncbi:unnamed protein product, partial [Mesorhabditis belari]|uniref:EF-hand domain-containing protein n=1 Tax=Mesorhabditis belari TaxID=2138241 RepID=A0AAF3FPE9_9BILA